MNEPFKMTNLSNENVQTPSRHEAVMNSLAELLDNPSIHRMVRELVNKENGIKSAYPNNDLYTHVPGQHNTDKWIQAIKDIYFKERQGENRNKVIREVTAGWKDTESFDFLNWLKFYEEGNHLKYKFASWYENGEPGYFLHINNEASVSNDAATATDVNSAKDPHIAEISSTQKKNIIEKQRRKIIGRLDSAEKLLRSEEGQLFANKELESLMEAIYNLKKKVQLVNKISTSVRLYEDMIIREANVLVKRGYSDAAEMLYALADDKKPADPPPPADGAAPAAESTPPPPASSPSTSSSTPPTDTAPPPPADTSPPPPADDTPPPPDATATTPAPPAPPAQGSGSAGGLPAAAPKDNNSTPKPKGIGQFLNRMETAGITTKDNHGADDYLEVIDEDGLWSQAQAAPLDTPPPAPVAPPVENKTLPEEPLEVSEEDVKSSNKEAPPATSDFDNKVNNVFSQITVNDVVAKLEDLAKIFKTREVPRQLAIVDMMLDSLGLASYFPSLSEATNKALESNNYISTRIDDILSKLHGAMETQDIDLKGETGPSVVSPEVAGVKSSLQEESDKEKARKELRKQQQDAELETPEVEIEEGTPASAPIAAPVAPVPATPPATK